jgi:hypothetical protein
VIAVKDRVPAASTDQPPIERERNDSGDQKRRRPLRRSNPMFAPSGFGVAPLKAVQDAAWTVVKRS